MGTRRDRRQFQLTGVQISLLAACYLFCSALVFFLGFYVGNKNAAAHVPHDERVARIPVDDFSKYSRLAGAAATQASPGDKADLPAVGGAAKAGAHVKADAKGPARGAEAVTDLKSAAGREGGSDMKGETRGPATAEAAGLAPSADDNADASVDGQPWGPFADDNAVVQPVVASDAKSRRKDKEPSDDTRDEKAVSKETAAAAAADTKAADAKAAKNAKLEEEKKKAAGGYTVQVLATRKQADAEALVKKLAARGYGGAYIKRVSDGQTSWYRVRVGRYGAFGEASTTADRCRRELGLEQAFVSTE